MSIHRKSVFAVAALLLSAAGASASDSNIQPATASIVNLGGGASALTYWADGANGRNVVTTVDTIIPGNAGGEDRHSIVRFSGVLLPGQSQTISVPSPDQRSARALKISRHGGRIEVTQIPASPSVPQKTASVD